MKRVVTLLILATVALVLIIFPAVSGATGSANLQAVIVHTAKPYDAVIGGIEALGGMVTYQYANVDGLAAQIPADKLADLQAMAGVDMVAKDLVMQMPTPREGYGPQAFDMASSDLLSSADLAGLGVDLDNYYSYLSNVTGAVDTWDDTDYGEGSLVAVIDTGTQANHVCLDGRVIEGPDFSTDAGTMYEGSTVETNYYHGTFVGGMVASDCALLRPAGDPFDIHLPPEAKIDIGGGLYILPLYGMAPAAEIYAVKVFPHTGAGAATSRINAAIDDVITQKLSGNLDIDVLNMSLGGAALNDGRTLNEMLVDAATDAGIVVVNSAGNEGPSPNSVGRAATAYSSIAVAAATDPVHTRIYWDYFYGPGAGYTLYPEDELRVSDFSGQGPNADGRQAPDIIATGVYNFGPFSSATGAGLGWSSGTSFSGPVVAGAAALLNAWAENNAPDTTPLQIRNALLDGAVPMDSEWSIQEQGHGYVNAANSLGILMSGGVNNGLPRNSAGGKLRANVNFDMSGQYQDSVTLERGRWAHWVFEIDENTEKIIIDIKPVGGAIPPGPSGAVGFDESFELYVKSAKRGGVGPDWVDSANVFDDATIEISAGSAMLSGGIAGNLVTAPPVVLEPGLMKVTLQSDWTNNTQYLSADVTITRVQGASGNNAGGATMTLAGGESHLFAINIPENTTKATFDLSWQHDWTKLPTNDLDMLFVSPSSFPGLDLNFLEGASTNSPERQMIDNPEAGTWYILIDGYNVYTGRDPYVLDVTFE